MPKKAKRTDKLNKKPDNEESYDNKINAMRIFIIGLLSIFDKNGYEYFCKNDKTRYWIIRSTVCDEIKEKFRDLFNSGCGGEHFMSAIGLYSLYGLDFHLEKFEEMKDLAQLTIHYKKLPVAVLYKYWNVSTRGLDDLPIVVFRGLSSLNTYNNFN